MKENIYFLINSLEWWWAERVVTNLITTHMEKWVTVFLITLKDAVFFELPEWLQYISLSRIKNNFLLFILLPWYVYKLKKILKNNKLSTWVSFLEIANFVHILAKKDAVISFRTHIHFFTGLVWYIYIFFIKLLYPRAKKIIVNSWENKYDIAHYLNIPEDKIEVEYNAINRKAIRIASQEPLPKEVIDALFWKTVFITVWRLIPSKHHEKIIAWLSLIYHNISKNWIYLVVGDWPTKEKIQRMVVENELINNVLFVWAQKNVFNYLHVADYFLYASSVEWFPNVLAEAKEMHIPIITSDFKSWAKEVVIGEYTKELAHSIVYPYTATYGTLLDLRLFEVQLVDWYKSII